jgi:hypothetical protein
MKLLILQFSPISRHFNSLPSKNSSQDPVLKHPQSMFLPLCQETKFHNPIEPQAKLGHRPTQLKSIYFLSLSLWLYRSLDLGRFFSFLTIYEYTVSRTPWTGHQPVARPLHAHRITQTHNKRTQTFMPLVGFEPTIPVFERAKMVHA